MTIKSMRRDRKKILMIDDDPAACDIYLRKLKESNFDVVCELDPLRAIPAVLKFRPDLILLDVHMPGINGYDILKEIRKSPGSEETKVIFLTNMSKIDDIEKGAECDAEDYIIKTFNTPSEVIGKIKNILGMDAGPQRMLVPD
ncbi:response regulator [bacterium]|nr:response regulator [bacterium]